MKKLAELSFDAAVRAIFPSATILVLIVAMAVPIRSSVPFLTAPSLPLLALFFWLLYRPDTIPAVAAFGFGLLHDILSGSPFGVHAIGYVVAHAAVSTQRRFFFGKSFSIVWLGFAVVVMGTFFLTWGLASVYHGTVLSPGSSILQAISTICVYPAFAWLLAHCEPSGPKKN